MSLRTIDVQYIGSCLRLPKLEREVMTIVTEDGAEYCQRGECEMVYERNHEEGVVITAWGCSCNDCGKFFEFTKGEGWNFCPNCGKAVKR